jgi:hypothetical protein
MDEQIQDVELDTSNEPTEEVVKTNEVEEGAADAPTEDIEALKEQLKKKDELNKKLFERAKKAEGFVLKDGKWVKVQKPQTKPEVSPDISDELRLIARGLSDEDIDQAKVIAKGRGIPLVEALKDPLYEAYKKEKEEREKREKSHLGGTTGSGQEIEEPLVKPGMTREEHQKLFKEMLGK